MQQRRNRHVLPRELFRLNTFRPRKILAGGHPRHGERHPGKELQTDSGTRRCSLMVTVGFITEKELKTWPADECLHRCACSCVCVNKPSVGGFSGPLGPRDPDCPPGLKCPGHARRPPWAVNRLALSQHRLQSPGGKPGPVFHGERLMDVREDDMAWARVQMYSNSRAFQRRLPISLHSVPAVTETAGQFFFFLLTELPVFHLETARGESLSPVSEQRAQAESRVG